MKRLHANHRKNSANKKVVFVIPSCNQCSAKSPSPCPISPLQNLFLRDFLVNSMGRANRRWRFARPKTIFSPLSQWERGLGVREFWTDTKLQSMYNSAHAALRAEQGVE